MDNITLRIRDRKISYTDYILHYEEYENTTLKCRRCIKDPVDKLNVDMCERCYEKFLLQLYDKLAVQEPYIFIRKTLMKYCFFDILKNWSKFFVIPRKTSENVANRREAP